MFNWELFMNNQCEVYIASAEEMIDFYRAAKDMGVYFQAELDAYVNELRYKPSYFIYGAKHNNGVYIRTYHSTGRLFRVNEILNMDINLPSADDLLKFLERS